MDERRNTTHKGEGEGETRKHISFDGCRLMKLLKIWRTKDEWSWPVYTLVLA